LAEYDVIIRDVTGKLQEMSARGC